MLDAEKIWQSKQLPTLPSVAVQLLELSRNPETEISEIVDLIRTDPAIAARILQATNSSYFSFSSQVTTVDRAVTLLGTTVVTSLALSFSLASDSITSGPLQTYYRSYWKQSVVNAVAAELLGSRIESGLECEYFLAGLLVDIGRLAMLKTIAREYYPVLVTYESQGRPLSEVEHEFLGLDHALISFKLMENWGLPEAMIRGIKLQHLSLETLQELMEPGKNHLEAAIVMGNAVGDYFMTPASGLAMQRINHLGKCFFQMDESTVQQYLHDVRSRVDEAAELFSMDVSDIGEPTEIMSQANQQLLELTIRARSETLKASEQQKQIEREKQLLASENEQLQQRATIDKLTGVHNRGHFDEALLSVVRRSADRSMPVAVIFIDIDHFKQLNDTHGHQFGDEVLKQFAAIVQKNMRNDDLLCRYGGEEFVVIVHRPTEKGLAKLAERIRVSIEQAKFANDGERIPVTASFGTAMMMPGRKDYSCGEHIMKEADEALYEAKQNGRNQVRSRCLMNDNERTLIREVNNFKFSRWLVSKEIVDIPTISRILLQVPPDQRSVGEIAVDMGVLQIEQVDRLANSQNRMKEQRFGDLAIEAGLMTKRQLHLILAWQIEPPERLMSAMIANNLFSAERSHELRRQYETEMIPGEEQVKLEAATT